MPAGRASKRLTALARPLAPERPPFYQRLPVPPGLESTYQAPGWYWVPHDHHVAVYLGASFETAALALHRLNAEQESQAA